MSEDFTFQTLAPDLGAAPSITVPQDAYSVEAGSTLSFLATAQDTDSSSLSFTVQNPEDFPGHTFEDSGLARSSLLASLFRSFLSPLRLTASLLDGKRVLVAQSVPENLTEMFARKARRSTAVWGSQYVEDPSTYVWQPETFMYHDVTTGHEVWKMSNTPGLRTYYYTDIGVSPWSADGRKIAYTAFDRVTQAYSESLQQDWRYIWMTSDTNGTSARPTVEASRRLGNGFFHWSPQQPNTWYEIGEAHLASGGQSNVLYRSTVDAQGVVTSTGILTLPAAAAGSIINKLISADGRRLILERTSNVWLWPISILADDTAQLDDPNGYSMDRDFGPYGGMGGGTVASYHDQYMAGFGDYFFVMPTDPNTTSTWWRMKTAGSAADGGPLYTGDDAGDFGEVWPENHATVAVGNTSSPFVANPVNQYDPDLTSYWSHFVPDRWGRHALFSNVADGLPGGTYYEAVGAGVWDITNHEWVVPSFMGGSQHHDWHGFTDWTVSSEVTGNGVSQLLTSGNINDATSKIVVNKTYTRYDGGTDYDTLARPGQSPDG
ncbi:MAG: hypothetical protein AAB728_02325, partial [Patescibacteria group bacterium]